MISAAPIPARTQPVLCQLGLIGIGSGHRRPPVLQLPAQAQPETFLPEASYIVWHVQHQADLPDQWSRFTRRWWRTRVAGRARSAPGQLAGLKAAAACAVHPELPLALGTQMPCQRPSGKISFKKIIPLSRSSPHYVVRRTSTNPESSAPVLFALSLSAR